MFVGGYSTDDLTDRQHHYFQRIFTTPTNNKVDAMCFVQYCVSKNFSWNQFSNYDGDCDYLFRMNEEKLNKYGIDLEEVY